MVAMLKRMSDFTTYRQMNVLSYDLALESRDEYKSNVTAPSDAASQTDRDAWFVFRGNIWLLSTVTPKNDTTTLRLLNPINAFDRDVFYTAPAEGTTMEAFIASLLETEFKAQADPFFAMPYLDITYTGETAFVAPEADDNGIFNVLEYLRLADESYGIRVRLKLSGKSLCVQIEHRAATARQVIFDDGHAQLVKQAYSSGSIGKVTTLQNGVVTDWYLSMTGLVSNSAPSVADRAPGGWELKVIGDDDDAEEKAREIFAKNAASHKIEFWSDRAYALGDPVRFRINKSVFDGAISFVGIRSGDNRTYYKSGELAISLVDKLRGVI